MPPGRPLAVPPSRLLSAGQGHKARESNPIQMTGQVECKWVGKSEEVVAPAMRHGKRKPLSADLPRIEVIHDLPEHELTCACGCRKHVISEEVSEQLEIVQMQIRVIKHVRKVYGSHGCETAPVTADKPAQLIEKRSTLQSGRDCQSQ